MRPGVGLPGVLGGVNRMSLSPISHGLGGWLLACMRVLVQR
jgi:hypothetical protein